MAELKVGDVVQLRSGGPDMVISGRTTGGSYECMWFNNTGDGWKQMFGAFKPETLEPVKTR